MQSATLWKIENGQLWVRDGAWFKDVDLIRGEIHLSPTALRRLSVKVKWALCVEFLWWLMFASLQYSDLNKCSFWGIVAGCYVLHKLSPKLSPSATILFASNGEEDCQRKPRYTFAIMALSIGCIVTSFILLTCVEGSNYWLNVSLLIAGVVLFVLVSWIRRRHLPESYRYASYRNGWFRLDGVDEKIIAHLSSAASSLALPNHPR